MTIMPAHTARLAETTELLVLDPSVGPVPRPVADLALGDEVLVAAEGRICFRRVMVADEAPPPEQATTIAAGGLSPGMPSHALTLDSRQFVGLRTVPGPIAVVTSLPNTAPDLAMGYWVDLTVEGAERIIAENIAIATGPLDPAEAPLQATSRTSIPATPAAAPAAVPQAPSVAPPPAAPMPSTPTAILHAFSGATELPLLSVTTEGSLSSLRFSLPPRTTTLRLTSPSVQPAGDGRRLGVAVFRIVLEAAEIGLDSPALVRGFHRAESGQGMTWRWTDGEALLILPPKPTQQTLSIHITDWHLRLQP